jgi:hypothetical protein
MSIETRIRSNNNQGGGGATANTSAIVYAPTGGAYVAYVADAQLSSEKVLTASNNITITTDAGAIYISANTGTGGGSGASTAGNYVVFTADAGLSNEKVLTASNNIIITTDATTIWLSANTGTPGSGIIYAPTGAPFITFVADNTLSNEKILTASNNITITTDGSSVFITALTPTVIAQSGGTVYTSTGSYFVLSQTDGSLPNSKVIVASNNMTVTTDSTRIFLTALTPTIVSQSGGTIYAPTGAPYIVFVADNTLSNEKILTASNNITITTDSTSIFISANTGTGGGSGASTAGNYVVFSADAGLSNEKVLTASDNVTITTDSTTIWISATTNSATGGGASTAGNFIVFSADAGLSNEKVLTASNNITITTDASSVFITALTPTVVAQSGGTVYTSTGSFFLLSETDGTLPNSKVVVASNNMTVTTSSTQMFLSANTGATIFFAPTGGEYVTWADNSTLSNEKILTASNNIQITTSSTQVFVTALTPTVTAQSGGTVYTATGSYFLLSQTDGSLPNSKVIVASNNITVTTSATQMLISANTGATIFFAPTNAPYITFLADSTLSNEKILTASNNILITTGATQVFLTATTSFYAFASTATTLTASSGLSGGGDLSADRTFSVNTNVRDKILGFYGAGNLSTAMLLETQRVYIPFNMQLIRVNLAVESSATGAAIIVQLNQYNNTISASTGIFASANRPQIAASASVGSSTTFDIGSLYAGSYLGVQMDQVGSSVAGSNLTITLITRTS